MTDFVAKKRKKKSNHKFASSNALQQQQKNPKNIRNSNALMHLRSFDTHWTVMGSILSEKNAKQRVYAFERKKKWITFTCYKNR